MPVIGECLEPLDLVDAKDAVAPVERPHVVRAPRLDRPRRQAGAELQQERPVARPPDELRIGMSALLGEIQIIVARRDLTEKFVELPTRKVTGVVSILLGVEIPYRLPGRL